MLDGIFDLQQAALKVVMKTLWGEIGFAGFLGLSVRGRGAFPQVSETIQRILSIYAGLPQIMGAR